MWYHKTLDHQLALIQRIRRIIYDYMWQQVKMWRTFPNDRHWKSLRYWNWTRYFVSGLQQCVLKESVCLGLLQLKKLRFFMMKC